MRVTQEVVNQDPHALSAARYNAEILECVIPQNVTVSALQKLRELKHRVEWGLQVVRGDGGELLQVLVRAAEVTHQCGAM